MSLAASRSSRIDRRGSAAVAMVALLASCRQAVEPIRVDNRQLVVENLTTEEWRDVTVTVNAYYRGGTRTLAPGGRLEGPLRDFVTGLGQRLNVGRERVWRVEVRATTAAGKPVALDWSPPGPSANDKR